MKKPISFTGVVVGLMLIAAVSLSGSAGLWQTFSVPPIIVGGIAALLLQWVGFAVAWRYQTERFFDLLGSGTFLVIVLMMLAGSRSNLGLLDIFLGAAVSVWAIRLGWFLVARIRLTGSDKRFEKIKADFLWFLMTWTLQGTWVVVTSVAAVSVIGDGEAQQIGLIEVIGFTIWALGMTIEVVADEQKKKFRRAGTDSFIRTGLWSRSRHPNYFGEVLLWSGLSLSALPSLNGWQMMTLVSPIFVWTLLMKVSGVPMLEAKADHRWRDDASYAEYKKSTPLLVPRLW
ncbi:MAG: hypothetical protein CL458_03565 [Acidimicrobiaceae bacterium]|nr:hypothetical protein [Acidimicrobiaceae bacterium]|tara:strand:- start:2535 stop:3395 length:861 start_codon:yes stop_codon:yes gene_type:complete